uniref:condensation domain-containing protein n=1 Tax=uncultured Aquimarina sp. TaxID=575652 RepID=UPI002622D670
MNAIIQKELIDVDKQSLSKAIDTLVSRHESLRTLFLEREGMVLQKIYAEDEFITNLSFENICKEENKQEKIKSIVDKAHKYLFDFEKEQSFKCKLIKYEKSKYVFIFVIDHIIYDAYSLRIIDEELFLLYNSYCKGISNPLEPLKLQLRDYVSYHLQHYFGAKLAYHQSYFDNLFKNIPPRLRIKSNSLSNKKSDLIEKSSEIDIPDGGAYVFMLSKEMMDQIQMFITEMKISFFNFMLVSYGIFLSKISDQNDFVIDSPMSTRNNEDFSKIIGW